MCGIAGVISCRGSLDAAVVKEMTDLVTYRGPDDEGFACWGNVKNTASLPAQKFVSNSVQLGSAGNDLAVVLGHRRLSILDLSATGHQPMSTNGRFWIVFNGEIYNYKELRTELQAMGKAFVSTSDTEVILSAYATWGEACLNRFNGMWAFAIYDSFHHSLFASRDRFGVKPFYYAVAGDRVAFASEIKQLRAAGFGTGRADKRRVAEFLHYGIVNESSHTLFEGIRQLLPGHALRWRIADGPERIDVFRYYAPDFNRQMGSNGGFSLDEHRERFDFLLRDAVRLRLRSDVPVGVALSGGLDSSSVAMLASKQLREHSASPLKTFTSCFEDKRYDEWEFASSIVKASGAQPYQVFPDMDRIWEEMARLAWHQDEPFRTSSVYAEWNVMRLAHQNDIKVLLQGQGADEVLVGYHRHIPDFLGALVRSGHVLAALREYQALRRTGVLTASDSPFRVWAKILRSSAGVALFRESPVGAMFRPEYRTIDREPPSRCFQQTLFTEIFGYLQSLLRHGDRNSMAFSVESRLPFLDYRLVELFLKMPGIYKLRDGWTKPFAREAMRNLMPENVRLRVTKLGFATPEPVWYRTAMESLRQSLLASDAPIQNWIDRAQLSDWLGDQAVQRQSGSTLWRIFSVNMWMKIFALA